MNCGNGTCTPGTQSFATRSYYDKYSGSFPPDIAGACNAASASYFGFFTGDNAPNAAYGGFHDPFECAQWAVAGNPGNPYNNNTPVPAFPIECCSFPAMYSTNSAGLFPPDVVDTCVATDGFAVNTANCGFSYDFFGKLVTTSGVIPGLDVYTPNQRVFCGYNLKPGIIDALVAPFVQITVGTNTGYWGVGLPTSTAFANTRRQCYDGTAQQQLILYQLTHLMCPDLSMEYSYSGPIEAAIKGQNALYPANDPDFGAYPEYGFFNWPCCSLFGEPVPMFNIGGGPGGSILNCSAYACPSSPLCQKIIYESLSNQATWDTTPIGPVGPGNPFEDMPAYSNAVFANLNQTTSVVPTDWISVASYSDSGAVPSAVDTVQFALQQYCKTHPGDSITCAAILDPLALNGGLLFPRLSVIDVDLLTPQYTNALQNGVFQTLTFSITNQSNILLQSLSVLTLANTDVYSVQILNPTLAPGASSGVVFSTILTGPETGQAIYTVLSNTKLFDSDYFNRARDNCGDSSGVYPQINGGPGCTVAVGSDNNRLPSSCIFTQPTEPIASNFPNFPLCSLDADDPIGTRWRSITASVTYNRRAPLYSKEACEAINVGYYADGGLSPYATWDNGFWNCDCASASYPWECSVAGPVNSCAHSLWYEWGLSSFVSCTTTGDSQEWKGFYFVDSITWADATDKTRRDYPILGGFAGLMARNPVELSLVTSQLLAFPLTNPFYMNP